MGFIFKDQLIGNFKFQSIFMELKYKYQTEAVLEIQDIYAI